MSIIRKKSTFNVMVTTCQYLPCGTRKARVITDLLHEQLAKVLLLYCVPKKDAKFLRKAHCAASFNTRPRSTKNKPLDFNAYLDRRPT